MSDKLTAQEFAVKVDWEGGVFSAFEYGLRSSDIEDDGSLCAEVLIDRIRSAEIAYKKFSEACRQAESALKDVLDDLRFEDAPV